MDCHARFNSASLLTHNDSDNNDNNDNDNDNDSDKNKNTKKKRKQSSIATQPSSVVKPMTIKRRFNERFILSLSSNTNCCVMDDELNILPISSHIKNMNSDSDSHNDSDGDSDKKKKKTRNTPNGSTSDGRTVSFDDLALPDALSSLLRLAKTADQSNAILTFLDAASEKR